MKDYRRSYGLTRYRVAEDELDRIRATWPGIEGEVVASHRGGFALRLRGLPFCPDGITVDVGREAGQTLDLFPDPPRRRDLQRMSGP